MEEARNVSMLLVLFKEFLGFHINQAKLAFLGLV